MYLFLCGWVGACGCVCEGWVGMWGGGGGGGRGIFLTK